MECHDASCCVYYATDSHYAVQTGVSLYTLCENNRELPELDIWMFVSDIEDSVREKYLGIAGQFGRTVHIVESADVYSYISRQFHMNLSAYDQVEIYIYVLRLFALDYLADKYDTALYIDADTIVRGNVFPAMNYVKDTPLAMVLDTMPAGYKKTLGISPEEPYYNSGVIAANLKLWRERQCVKRILDHMLKVYSGYWFREQDLLNIVLQDETAVLPLRFNVMTFYPLFNYSRLRLLLGRSNRYYTEEEYLEASQKPVITHLVEAYQGRPWQEGNTNPCCALWEDYARKAGWEEWPTYEIHWGRRGWFQTKTRQLLGPGAFAWMVKLSSLYNDRFAADLYKSAQVGAWRPKEDI